MEHLQLCHGASTCVPRDVCGTFPRCILHVDFMPYFSMFALYLVALPSAWILLANTKNLTLFDDLIKSLCVPKAKAHPTIGGSATRQALMIRIKLKE